MANLDKITYDPTNMVHLARIMRAIEGLAKDQITATALAPYVAEGADPKYLVKIVKNAYDKMDEAPKSKPRRKSTYNGKGNRKYNPAVDVTKRETLNKLMS